MKNWKAGPSRANLLDGRRCLDDHSFNGYDISNMNHIPDEGDIIWIDFEPNSGKEIDKIRPALVLSPATFNKMTGLAIIVPITSKARSFSDQLAIPLPSGLQTSGRCATWQVRSLDYQARGADFIEKAPERLLSDVRDVVSRFIGL